VFQWRQLPLRVTVSIGTGSGTLGSNENIDVFNELLVEADEYLYRAKKAGRNKTCAKSLAEEGIFNTVVS